MTEADSLPPAFPAPVAVAYPVPGLGIIRVHGQDAMKVLSGLCTAKLQDLAVGGAQEAFFTDDRGRVLAHAVVGRDADGAWVVGQLAQPDALTAHIDRFIFREDAAPRDVTAAWSGRLLDGTEAVSRLTQIAKADQLQIGGLGWGAFQVDSLDALVVRLPITSSRALLCLVAAEHASELDRLLESASFQIQPSSDEFESRRIANFWPVAGREISDRTLPQELDRDERAISFTKGCYLGQETVARLDALGEVQKKLCLVQLGKAADPEAGQPLMRDGNEVGKLTSIAPLAAGEHRLALAYMRRGSFAPGSQFELAGIPGEVVRHA
ncbi:MAG: CAF17-like 4Fe-4S cluster assembly/insertion protein YgfZ [Aureliella sp.]